MKSYSKIILILVLSIAITVFLSPIIASILPFHLYKITSRISLIVTFLLFYYFRDILGIHTIKSLGFSSNKRWWGHLGLGFSMAVLSIGIIASIMLYFHIRYTVPDISYISWIQHLAGYILIGLIVALVEETFFRGFILQSLLKDTRLTISLIITNIFYSVVHFLKPQKLPEIEILNLTSSLKTIPLYFKPILTEWINIWPSLLCLFLVGLVLSLAYLRTHSLALSIGLHAGWILGIKSLSFGTDVTSTGSIWISGKVTENPLSWIVMLVFVVILGWRKNINPVKTS